jgi:hypothetical protein
VIIVMEFLLCLGLIGLAIGLIAVAIEADSKVDPAKLGGDLGAALGRGDSTKGRKLLGKLPEWKIVDWLKKVVDSTCDLRRDSSAAAQAGVPPETLSSLQQVIGRNEEIVVVIARKVAALGLQSEGKFKKLPPAARDLLDTDVRRLEEISRASQTVRNSLAVATASVQGGDAASRADALEAFGRALRELGNS